MSVKAGQAHGSSSGSDGPAVWCPPVQRPPVRCPPVRWSAGCCPPPSVRTRPSRPTSGGGVGDQAGAAGNRHHRVGSRSLWAPRRRAARSTAEQAWGRRCRGRALSSRDVGGRPGPGWVRAAARTRRATRRARPACGAPVAGGARAREQAGGTRWPRLPHSCRPVLGGRPRCVVVVEPAARVGGLKGPMAVPTGIDVRPQRGPRWQRPLPARCRQRCDLRECGVGLPGLEPGTSSLSAIEGSPLCGPAFSQVVRNRRGCSNAL
jgi:hypothetical protein